MAGTYTDIPGHRFDLSKDGSVLFGTSDSQTTPSYFTATQIAAAMDLDFSNATLGIYHSNTYGSSYLNIVFPEPRKITGLYWQTDADGGNGNAAAAAFYSLDSIDGINGTFTAWGSSGARAVNTTAIPFYRNAIYNPNQDGVRAIRLRSNRTDNNGGTQYFRTLHIYGFRPTASIDRLAFWHPTLDQELGAAYFDFGDLNRGVISGGRPFRIKNLSSSKVATGVQISAVGLTGSNFSTPGLQVSNDDQTYTTLSPAFNLNAGAISGLLYARLNLGDTLMLPQARSGRLATLIGSYA